MRITVFGTSNRSGNFVSVVFVSSCCWFVFVLFWGFFGGRGWGGIFRVGNMGGRGLEGLYFCIVG